MAALPFPGRLRQSQSQLDEASGGAGEVGIWCRVGISIFGEFARAPEW